MRGAERAHRRAADERAKSAAHQFEGGLVFIYAFAGPLRKSGVTEFMVRNCTSLGIRLFAADFDIVRNFDHDMLSPFAKVLRWLATNLQPCAFLGAPPCDSWSRAHWVYGGPPPLRSPEFPLGFPWLKRSEGQEGKQASLRVMGNLPRSGKRRRLELDRISRALGKA
jgi:hypothetical protein